LAKALALIPSGCSIITAGRGESATGMLASWVQQASFDPPHVTVSVKEGRPIQAIIAESGRFVLNLLGEDPGAMFKHFGAGFGPGEPAFEGLEIDENQWGVELLAAAGTLSCEVRSSVTAADHVVYVAQVCSTTVADNQKPYVHIRKSGLSY
jgi:flavin reductase (DIM6/NTAB) family NADH-FMN oxidoreductase RutF